MEAALERGVFPRPEVPPEEDRLVDIGPTGARPVRHRKVPVLVLVPAETDAGGDAPSGEDVDRRQLLRQDDRLPHRHDEDARHEPDPVSLPADPGERRDDLEHRAGAAARSRPTMRWSSGSTVRQPSRSAACAVARIASGLAPACFVGRIRPT
jgi:hypothetical protein